MPSSFTPVCNSTDTFNPKKASAMVISREICGVVIGCRREREEEEEKISASFLSCSNYKGRTSCPMHTQIGNQSTQHERSGFPHVLDVTTRFEKILFASLEKSFSTLDIFS